MLCRISRSIWRRGTWLYERGYARKILQRGTGGANHFASGQNEEPFTGTGNGYIYYRSHLAQKIHEGQDDVQYLDYKVLVQILLDTEPELLA